MSTLIFAATPDQLIVDPVELSRSVTRAIVPAAPLAPGVYVHTEVSAPVADVSVRTTVAVAVNAAETLRKNWFPLGVDAVPGSVYVGSVPVSVPVSDTQDLY
jgi:hypothetical protein